MCVTLSDAVRMATEHHAAGNSTAAEYICKQVLAMDRHQAEALELLGMLGKTHADLARDLIARGELDRAEAELHRAIELDPSDPQFAVSLGKLLHSRNKPAAAIFTLTEAIRRFPDFAPAYTARGTVLGEHRLLEEALADHRRAVELDPSQLEAHLQLARALGATGDVDAARAACQRAIDIAPASADAWECLGRILQTNGRFDEAAAAFVRCREIEPRPAVEMLLGLMGRNIDDQQVEQLARRFDDPSLSPRDRVAAGFALGKMLDGQDRFDEAFAVYARANSAFKEFSEARGIRFDAADLRANVDAVIETFFPDFFRARQEWGSPSQVPVFIVGMPRSGTTLVEQIVASHSKVFGAGERFDIAMIRSRLATVEHGDSPNRWTRAAVRCEADAHVQLLATLGNSADRVIDKMPGNLMDLGTIATLFPQARVIFCAREPRDTCLSCYFQLFSNHDLMFSYDLTDCSNHHREYDRLTAHWQRVLPLRMLTVQYEELVADLEGQSRRLNEFLGLDWEPACLEFHKTDRPVLTSSFWQVRQPIYSKSAGRWKQYKKHLAPLGTALAESHPK